MQVASVISSAEETDGKEEEKKREEEEKISATLGGVWAGTWASVLALTL